MTTESKRIEGAESARKLNRARRCSDCGRPRIVTTKFVPLREMPEYCLRDYARSDANREMSVCTPEDALEDCRDATRPIDALVWLLTCSITGWKARVSDQFGDDVTARLREWIIQTHQIQPRGPRPRDPLTLPDQDASRLELQQVACRLGLVGTGWDSAEKIIALLDLLEVPRTPRNTTEIMP